MITTGQTEYELSFKKFAGCQVTGLNDYLPELIGPHGTGIRALKRAEGQGEGRDAEERVGGKELSRKDGHQIEVSCAAQVIII